MCRTMRRAAQRAHHPQKHPRTNQPKGKKSAKRGHRERKSKLVKSKQKYAAKAKRGK